MNKQRFVSASIVVAACCGNEMCNPYIQVTKESKPKMDELYYGEPISESCESYYYKPKTQFIKNFPD